MCSDVSSAGTVAGKHNNNAFKRVSNRLLKVTSANLDATLAAFAVQGRGVGSPPASSTQPLNHQDGAKENEDTAAGSSASPSSLGRQLTPIGSFGPGMWRPDGIGSKGERLSPRPEVSQFPQGTDSEATAETGGKSPSASATEDGAGSSKMVTSRGPASQMVDSSRLRQLPEDQQEDLADEDRTTEDSLAVGSAAALEDASRPRQGKADSASLISPSLLEGQQPSSSSPSSAQASPSDCRPQGPLEAPAVDAAAAGGMPPADGTPIVASNRDDISATVGTPRFRPEAILDQVYGSELLNPGNGCGHESWGAHLATQDDFLPSSTGDQLFVDLQDMGSISFTRPQLNVRFAVVGNSRQILGYAETELAYSLNNWSIAAVSRCAMVLRLCNIVFLPPTVHTHRLLSLDNILIFLTAALLEQQVVVFCPCLASCSAVVLSLVPMLRPYSYQCLILPVTPSAMMPLLDAPVPFVLGLQYKTPEVAAKCQDLVRINVYKDQVSQVGLPSLPAVKRLREKLLPYYTRLREAAPAAERRPMHVVSEEEKQAARGFAEVLRHHLGTMLGDIRPHVITNVSLGRPQAGILMKGSLLETIPARDRAFVKIFLETQLFAVWSDHEILEGFGKI